MQIRQTTMESSATVSLKKRLEVIASLQVCLAHVLCRTQTSILETQPGVSRNKAVKGAEVKAARPPWAWTSREKENHLLLTLQSHKNVHVSRRTPMPILMSMTSEKSMTIKRTAILQTTTAMQSRSQCLALMQSQATRN